jgi:hypothetical protein
MSYFGKPSSRPNEPSVAVPVNARLCVGPDPKGVAGTRRFTQQRAAALGADEEAQATAALLVSELITNVVLHARTSALIDIAGRGDCICVSVTDGSPLRPRLRSLRPIEVTGRGMWLVKDMAAASGVECDDAIAPGGKRVWFAIAKATPAGAAVNENARWNSVLESLPEFVV